MVDRGNKYNSTQLDRTKIDSFSRLSRVRGPLENDAPNAIQVQASREAIDLIGVVLYLMSVKHMNPELPNYFYWSRSYIGPAKPIDS